MVEMIGFDRAELMKLRVMDFHPPEAEALSGRAFAAISREGSVSFEIPFLRKDGSTFPAEVSSKIFDLGGRKVIQGIVRDMTERKEAERHVREYAEKLETSSRLKDLFTDILSHDLLNPASIVYNVSTILAQKEHPRDAEEVQMIQRNARKILELIRNATTYARVESFDSIERVDNDLVEIVDAQIESLKPILEAKMITCRCSLPAKAPVRVNPVIALVFENIISNAAKYSPEGSTITVSIEEGGGEWVTAVADEGPGIPDDEKAAVFERFRRREKKGVLGSGLGLAIAQRIVDLHSGTIRVEDSPGGGSCFIVQLRQAVPPSPAAG
ncbi:ATP-binding protein [Candidatus Moduliflexota bacterium]